jgi:3-oxoacyl-[acyl-carrier-protein] synthase II
MKKRVVITGIGVVTPLGNDAKTSWNNLKKGLSGIGPITKFDPHSPLLTSRIAGEVKNFYPEEYMPLKDVKRLDPFIHYAFASSRDAFDDAGLKISASGSYRGGVVIGSSRGGVMSMERGLERHLVKTKPFSAYLMSSSTINMASSYVAMRFGLKGPAIGISTACASGANAIGEAARMIRHGDLDFAIAGGAEAPVCRLAVGGYGISGALSGRNSEPAKASRPFDKDRDGFVIAEGAGIIVLEEREHALRRGAKVYAEIAGYGTTTDAFHQTKPDSSGEAAAMVRSLDDAGLNPDAIDYINAHATSTVLGDRAEAHAIREVFGARADKVPVSSCKSMLGHMIGGAGAVEAAITALSISCGEIVPSINLDSPDPELLLNTVTSLTSKEIHAALTNSFGFGGVNAVLVLKKAEG